MHGTRQPLNTLDTEVSRTCWPVGIVVVAPVVHLLLHLKKHLERRHPSIAASALWLRLRHQPPVAAAVAATAAGAVEATRRSEQGGGCYLHAPERRPYQLMLWLLLLLLRS